MSKALTETSPSSLQFSGWTTFVGWLLCLIGLGTILPLLGYLYGIGSMRFLALVALVPAIFVYSSVYFIAVRSENRELRLRFERGFIGGLLGIAGYDLVRVPIHFWGFNPFAAIQSYGMYLTGSDHSTLFTDFIGIIYHTGNGLFFGMMFTLVVGVGRLTSGLAIIWALTLELFAVITIFGEVYHLRDHPVSTALAFFAHLFYGAPLAWAAMRISITQQHLTIAVVAAFAGLGSIFLLMRPADGYRAVSIPGIEVNEAGLHPRWTRIESGKSLQVRNQSAEPVTIEFSSETVPPVKIDPGSSANIRVEVVGIIQVRAQRADWRSVFLISESNGYVSEP